MVNKYPAPCCYCGNLVPVNGGKVWKRGRKWVCAHLACKQTSSAEVVCIRTSTGSFTQNSRGRCIDAPCCGCCS